VVDAEQRRDHVDPHAQHDGAAAGGAVRHRRPGAGQHPGLPGAAGAGQPAGCPAGAGGEQAGAGGAELRGGVPAGGAPERSGHAGSTPVPVLQEQEESGGQGGGDPGANGGYPRQQTPPTPPTPPSPGGGAGGVAPGSRRGGWEEDEKQWQAQAASPWQPQDGGAG